MFTVQRRLTSTATPHGLVDIQRMFVGFLLKGNGSDAPVPLLSCDILLRPSMLSQAFGILILNLFGTYPELLLAF